MMRLVEEQPEVLVRREKMYNGTSVVVEEVEDSDSEEEEAEPVSATLVLRVVASEPPSPNLSRKSSFKRPDQPPAFLNTEENGGTFLQVQVQRSSSNSSLAGSRKQSRSRPPSATPSDADGWSSWDEHQQRMVVGRPPPQESSRESSLSPATSMVGEVDLSRTDAVNSVDFMARVNSQTKAIQEGLKTLRGEVDNPTKLLDIGHEALVLSGLNKQTGESLKNIKNLYDETKYLKSYLEKLEAKVHYDMTVKMKTPRRPPWYRRLLFLGLVACGGAVVWRQTGRSSFDRSLAVVGAAAMSFTSSMVNFFTRSPVGSRQTITIQ